MRIETFSIVKLYKRKYNTEELEAKDEATPRLLVLKSHSDTAQCMVRYPNGYIQRVEYQDITEKSLFTKDHPDYPKLLADMYAAQIEYNKNQTFRAFLEGRFPQLATEIAQKVEARNKRWAEKNPSSALVAPFTVPTPAGPVIVEGEKAYLQLLQSIDNKLGILIELWGGPYNGNGNR